jgi:hypothetical protein
MPAARVLASVAGVRLFLSDGAGARELTSGDAPVVRVTAPDLQRAQRERDRIRADREGVAVVLDVTVAVAGDFRAARLALAGVDSSADSGDTICYAGTLAGLIGLLDDIESAEVADGVTLIAAAPGQDLDRIGREVLRGLASRDQARAS